MIDQIFATRQLYTTRLWKLESNEEDKPIVTALQENRNLMSIVRSVALNHGILGELCELRSKELSILYDGYGCLLASKQVLNIL